MQKLINWFAGFFEDRDNNASSKRLSLYVCLFLLFKMVDGSLEGKTINETLLYVIGGIVLFDIGAITSEFLNKFADNKSATFSKTTTEESATKTN
jgi:hypothetical protein